MAHQFSVTLNDHLQRFIYYRAETKTVRIVCILHERMDVRTHFKGGQQGSNGSAD